MQDPLHPQPADADKPEQQWRAGSLYGVALLRALIADDQPQSLQAWATAAPAVLDAIAEAQAACSSSEGKPACVQCIWSEILRPAKDSCLADRPDIIRVKIKRLSGAWIRVWCMDQSVSTLRA